MRDFQTSILWKVFERKLLQQSTKATKKPTTQHDLGCSGRLTADRERRSYNGVWDGEFAL
jgi:hypothetical protein